MRLLPLLAALAAGCRAAPAPAGNGLAGGTPAPAPAPAPAPPAWEAVIGEYAAAKDTVSVLETGGRLMMLRWGGTAVGLDLLGGDTALTAEGAQVVIERAGAGAEGPEGPEGPGAAPRRPAGAAAALVLDGTRMDRIRLGPDGEGTFRIVPRRPVEELRREALAASPPEETGDFLPAELVELAALDSTIRLDIRYATADNFLGTPVYTSARAFLQRPAAEALARAHRRLAPLGYGLLVFDGYRPWYVTKIFWDATPEPLRLFVADPAQGSRHNRGCAVDLTLYDRSTGQPVAMPGGYDEMSPRSFPGYPGGTSRQRWHRDLLRRAMEAEGFTVYEAEWWHFDCAGWRRYRLGNQRFEELPPG